MAAYLKVGKWHVTSGIVDAFVEECGEDGPYTRRVPYLLVEAKSDYGQLYVFCSYVLGFEFKSEFEADDYIKALPADFNPADVDGWSFSRNIYGSEAYQDNWHEEEYSRMEPAERAGRY